MIYGSTFQRIIFLNYKEGYGHLGEWSSFLAEIEVTASQVGDTTHKYMHSILLRDVSLICKGGFIAHKREREREREESFLETKVCETKWISTLTRKMFLMAPSQRKKKHLQNVSYGNVNKKSSLSGFFFFFVG